MIHNAWTYGVGNANDFRKQADDLDKITQASVNAYMSRCTITEEEVKQLMDDETWLTAKEAKEKGFATGTMDEKPEGVSQSAMKWIQQRLLYGSESRLEIRDTSEIENRIAQKVAEKVVKQIKENSKEQGDSTGFSAFFNSGKGE
ncbi:MAG: Clp protease ClpP [Sellimonas intestinalis]